MDDDTNFDGANLNDTVAGMGAPVGGATHTMEVEVTPLAGTARVPNRHSQVVVVKKLFPVTFTMVPPVIGPLVTLRERIVGHAAG
jgi:hypothetical protein